MQQFKKRKTKTNRGDEPKRSGRVSYAGKHSLQKEAKTRVVEEKKNKKSSMGKQRDDIRLNKYIANTGLCSRREADQLISAGVISVNGKVTAVLGTKVAPSDVVKYNGKTLMKEKKVYILLNKPKDFITTTEDPFAKKKVTDLVQKACKERVYPVGRLDRMTTGVLLLTNDGELTTKLTHPKYNRKKIYHVFTDKNVKRSDLDQLVKGIELSDGKVIVDSVSYVDPVDKKQVGIEIHSGKNRIIRRLFEHLGYRITKLDRVYFAGLTKKGLTRGEWRYLKDKEISMLITGQYK
jgi:23S rRNA pseudouridine2605 synthase